MRTLTREKLFGILVKNNYLQKGGGFISQTKKIRPFVFLAIATCKPIPKKVLESPLISTFTLNKKDDLRSETKRQNNP